MRLLIVKARLRVALDGDLVAPSGGAGRSAPSCSRMLSNLPRRESRPRPGSQRQPGLIVLIILPLALEIGANITLFSVVNTLLLCPYLSWMPSV